MNITRRKLMASALAGCLSGFLLTPGARAFAPGAPSTSTATGAIPLEKLHATNFKEQLQGLFSITGEAGTTLALRLIAVTEQPSSPQLEHFSLIFQGPATPALPQKIYDFEHPAMGQFSIFIVPVGRNADGMQYEAIFNRLIG